MELLLITAQTNNIANFLNSDYSLLAAFLISQTNDCEGVAASSNKI